MERYGKYRAIVIDNVDPERRGRIKVTCPSALREAPSNWCEACVPIAGSASGDFYLPAVGDGVWIEFEQGDINNPIYVGSWWSKDQVPTTEQSGATRMITFKGNKIIMNNTITFISKEGTTVTLSGGRLTVNGSTVAFTSDI